MCLQSAIPTAPFEIRTKFDVFIENGQLLLREPGDGVPYPPSIAFEAGRIRIGCRRVDPYALRWILEKFDQWENGAHRLQ